ncbi:hypothetical protein RHGRI_010614 [Rhododendron griersonianum]|uniref:Uncharacterized protein n=1 Tax=Rhododendron griersonianum TaxID=479676 RepID=A0AAV6KJV2_9ERIC|nr:hypothetical protein RHGRI_010614 [Rhododendron griersonianum]
MEIQCLPLPRNPPLPLPLPRLPPPRLPPLPLPLPLNPDGPDLSGLSPKDCTPLLFPCLSSLSSSSSSLYFAELLETKEISLDPPGPDLTLFILREACRSLVRAATLSPKERASSFASDLWFPNASACRSSFTSYNLQVFV